MTYSTTFQETITKVNAVESPLTLVTIEHTDLGTPVRLVNDNQDLTSGGDLYQAYPFAFSFPTQPETGLPEARIVIDNLGKPLMTWLEASNGGAGATITLEHVLRSAPNTIEASIVLELHDIVITSQSINARMSYPNPSHKKVNPTRYDPINSPGLF